MISAAGVAVAGFTVQNVPIDGIHIQKGGAATIFADHNWLSDPLSHGVCHTAHTTGTVFDVTAVLH